MMNDERLFIQGELSSTDILKKTFTELREKSQLTDVTLATRSGDYLEAHKSLLAAYSPVFRKLFEKNPQSNILLYMKDLDQEVLKHMLDFMYNGRVEVERNFVRGFLETGREFQILGLEEYIDVDSKPEPTWNKKFASTKVKSAVGHGNGINFSSQISLDD